MTGGATPRREGGRAWDPWVDARDPHALADFWCAAMGYVVEDTESFIRYLLDGGAVPPDEVLLRCGRLSWRDAVGIRHPADPVDPERGTSLGHRVVFVAGEPSGVELAFALSVPAAAMNEELTRLCALGAVLVRRGGDGRAFLLDPEGNAFELRPERAGLRSSCSS